MSKEYEPANDLKLQKVVKAVRDLFGDSGAPATTTDARMEYIEDMAADLRDSLEIDDEDEDESGEDTDEDEDGDTEDDGHEDDGQVSERL